MIKNIWKAVRVFCADHEKPIPMSVYDKTASPFYACRRFMLKDDAHPDGHERDEPGCTNRISFDGAKHFVEEISKQLEENAWTDLTGTKMSWRGIEATVFSHTDRHIDIAIRNTNEIRIWNGHRV